MRRCSWFLILLLVLNLSTGSIMAMTPHMAPLMAKNSQQPAHITAATHAPDHQGHTAGPASHASASTMTPTASHANGCDASAAHADGHHCCAVGLGSLAMVWPHPVPAAQPALRAPRWQSVNLRPDLRPPIA